MVCSDVYIIQSRITIQNVPAQAIRHTGGGGSGGIASLIPNLGSMWGRVVSLRLQSINSYGKSTHYLPNEIMGGHPQSVGMFW